MFIKILFNCFLFYILGNPIQLVIFQPIQDMASQQTTIKITFIDDDIALEENEILQFTLSDPQGISLPLVPLIELIVTDDDG